MVGDTKQASSATTAVIFITIGALMAVWSTVYYFYLNRHEATDIAYMWCYGFFFSGVVLMAIGIGLGPIARAVRPAEVATTPPVQATTPVPPAPAPATPAVTVANGVQPAAPVKVAQTPR